MDNQMRLERKGWTVTDTGCWEFGGFREKQNYGIVKVNGKEYRAHRLAYETWVGPIPEGHVVRHKCDNPPCINPEHLTTGTQAENIADRQRRHRQANGARSGGSKLTEELVEYIRTEYAKGKITQRALAVLCGVSQRNISSVVTGETWTTTINH